MLAFSVYDGYSQTEKETDSIVETTINALDEIVIARKKYYILKNLIVLFLM
ncbi:hypothetical protein [Flavobacterium nitrogenifigens]|uniref:hypothetical protein n=1 Tax=Flavobacterium nitrogenifigens TaxID=1617283 RepID=UPI001FCC53F9|nr:hypothetical protein [Flavobacterium nitrogenifigens]